MEGTFYSQGRLMEYADSLRSLLRMYDGRSQDVMALQLKETMDMLDRLLSTATGRNKDERKIVENCLKGYGAVLKEMAFYDVGGHKELVIDIEKVRRGCVMAKELAAELGSALGIELEPAKGGRVLIGSDGGELIFEETAGYVVICGQAGYGRGYARVSGDNFSILELGNGKTVICLADGMGCGDKADMHSSSFLDMLEKMLESGYSETAACKLVNHIFASGDDKGTTVSLDMCSIDNYSAEADFIKMGAVPCFIKTRGSVRMIDAGSLPAGVLPSADACHKKEKLSGGDYVVMVSDGVLDALPFFDKEKGMKDLLSGIDATTPQAIASRILDEAVYFDADVSDDMTVLVAGIWGREKESHNVRKGKQLYR